MRIKLGTPLVTNDILIRLGIKTTPRALPEMITHLSTSSSLCQPNDLFIALRGERFDGADFLPEATARGAITLSSSRVNTDLCVKSSAEALLLIANLYKSRLTRLKETVAITGSVGKTTTREILTHILSFSYKIHSTEGNLNNTVGVPLTVLSAPLDTEILIIEAGMNSLGELYSISKCLEPTLAVITNIGTSHIGPLGTRDMIAKAKLEILSGMKKVRLIAPYDEPYLKNIEGVRTVSLQDGGADYRLCQTDGKSARFEIMSAGATLGSFYNRTLGSHIPNCLALGCAAALELGVLPKTLISALGSLPSELSRMKRVEFSGITLLDDSYNASAESVASALVTLCSVPAKRHLALLGDMLELGTHTEELHKECGALCAKLGVDYLFTFGVYSEFYAKGALLGGMSEKSVIKCADTLSYEVCADNISSVIKKGDALLIKASHAINISRVINYLKDRLRKEC